MDVCDVVEGNRVDPESNLHENKTNIANKPPNFPSILLQIMLCHCWEALNQKTNNSGEIVWGQIWNRN